MGIRLLILFLPILFAVQETIFVRKRFGQLHHQPNLVLSASIELFAIAAIECATLTCLYLALRAGHPARSTVVLAVAAFVSMLAIAMVTPTDADAYAYIGYAIVPRAVDAYVPPPTPFSGDFAAINQVWGTPMFPCVYGPVFLAYDRLLFAHLPSLAAAFIALKCFAIVVLLAFLALLSKFNVVPAALAVIALNPAFVEDFVTSAHNDLFAAVLSLCAILALRRGWIPVAVAVAAAAALIKITLLAVGVIVLCGYGTLRRRLMLFAVMLAIVVLCGALFGGKPFLTAMSYNANLSLADYRTSLRLTLTHLLAAAIAAAAIVLAFVRNRFWPAAVWAFSTINVMVYSWYQAWGIPYALQTPRSWALPALFIAWPLAQQMIYSPFGKVNLAAAMTLMIIVALGVPIAEFFIIRNRTAELRI